MQPRIIPGSISHDDMEGCFVPVIYNILYCWSVLSDPTIILRDRSVCRPSAGKRLSNNIINPRRMRQRVTVLCSCVCLKERVGVEVGLVNQPLDALNRAPCCGRGSCDCLGRAMSISAHVYRRLMYKLKNVYKFRSSGE